MKTIYQFESDFYNALDRHAGSTVVRVTRDFWQENVNKLSEILEHEVLATINIDDDWEDPDGYKIHSDIIYEAVYTIGDLKKVVDRIVEDGRGDLPVVMKDYEHKFYKPVFIAKIKPGLHPRDDLYLAKDWDNAPKGEHVLIYDVFVQYEESGD